MTPVAHEEVLASEEVKEEPEIEQYNTDWTLFKKESQLGEGAYGTVYRVKCIRTVQVNIENTQRIIMNKTNDLRQRYNLP